MAKGSGSFGAAFGSWYFNTSRIVLKQCGYQFSGMPTCFQMSSKLELWKKKEMNDTNILASLRIHVVLSFGCRKCWPALSVPHPLPSAPCVCCLRYTGNCGCITVSVSFQCRAETPERSLNKWCRIFTWILFRDDSKGCQLPQYLILLPCVQRPCPTSQV